MTNKTPSGAKRHHESIESERIKMLHGVYDSDQDLIWSGLSLSCGKNVIGFCCAVYI